MPTLAVIGAGPKGIAIAAKARALSAVGLDAPRVVLVDRSAVAGSWSGLQGYTSGLLPLGTPPEKDVGFPYADSWGRCLGCGHDGNGGVRLAAASDRARRLCRLGRSRPPAADAPAVERLPARGRREGRGRDRRRRAHWPRGRRRAVATDRRAGGGDLGRRRRPHRRRAADPGRRPAA